MLNGKGFEDDTRYKWLKINKKRPASLQTIDFIWWRGEDLNL
jgi:hypothetical protein